MVIFWFSEKCVGFARFVQDPQLFLIDSENYITSDWYEIIWKKLWLSNLFLSKVKFSKHHKQILKLKSIWWPQKIEILLALSKKFFWRLISFIVNPWRLRTIFKSTCRLNTRNCRLILNDSLYRKIFYETAAFSIFVLTALSKLLLL